MEEIIDSILHKLTGKGLIVVEIPRLIRDVLNIVSDEIVSSAADVNRRLEELGWEKGILDGHTFEQILYLLEQRGENGVMAHRLH
ncbi:MAG: hypothetical protein WAL98_03175 [Desulfatiglandaceae bacterium]